MSVPNHEAVIHQVYTSGSWSFTTIEGYGLFTEACVSALHGVDARWGHLRKNPGQTQYNGHAANAALYLSDAPGQSQAVDFIRLELPPPPTPTLRWLVDEPRYSASDWFAPEPVTPCLLGCSLFWGMAGVRSHLERLLPNLEWITSALGADYVRTFAVVGGDLFNGADPWRDAGSFIAWPDWSRLLGQYTDLCYDQFGLKVEWTLFGSRGQTPLLSDCEQVVAEFLKMAAMRPHKLALVEVWNEYNINGAASADLRHLARQLRRGLPAEVPIALSSPGAVHACASVSEIHAEVRKMHEGLPEATAITPHWCRADHVAPDLGPSAPASRYSNEPRGPGASGGGDVDDPATLANDYRAAKAAGYTGYVYHPLGGIWGGMCHPQWPEQNRWPDVFSSPNANATAAQLKAIRLQQPAPPLPDPGDPDVPLPPYDEPWISNVVRPAVIDRYTQAGHPLDDLYPVWITRTLYDHNAGMTKDASLAKHLAELEDALGLT